MLDASAQVLKPYLDPGEQLLWSGKPAGGIRFRAQDLFLIPFSLFWGGFAIVWETMALIATKNAPGPIGLIFPLFGVPFVLVGLYLIFGRFIVDARARDRTLYGVTNERILILSGLFSQQLKSLQIRTLPEISLTQRADKTGTITFGSSPFMNGFFPGGSWPGAARFAVPSFESIDRVKDVYDLIRKTQRIPVPNA